MFGREISAVDMVRREQRGRQMSVLMGIGSTGMAFGPALGGVLTDAVGVRGLFLTLAALCTVVFVISLAQQDSSRPTTAERRPFFNFRAVNQIHPFYRVTFPHPLLRDVRADAALPGNELHAPALQPGRARLFGDLHGCAVHAHGPGHIRNDRAHGVHLRQAWPEVGGGARRGPHDGGLYLAPHQRQRMGAGCRRAAARPGKRSRDGRNDHLYVRFRPPPRSGPAAGNAPHCWRAWRGESPPIAGVVATMFSAGASFWFFAPLHVLSAILLVSVARESLQGHRRHDAPTTEEIEAGHSAGVRQP